LAEPRILRGLLLVEMEIALQMIFENHQIFIAIFASFAWNWLWHARTGTFRKERSETRCTTDRRVFLNNDLGRFETMQSPRTFSVLLFLEGGTADAGPAKVETGTRSSKRR